jgi:pimeloyl-ACP methyl ester carboxylesterase
MTAKELAYSPCIIYCHGNAGNKIDIIEIFEFLLWEFNICSFDFSGAGYSEGDYVTLGYDEKDDIGAVIEYLRNELNIQKIILYGRSMGAVSSLRYAEMDPNLKAIVLDSPFSDFEKLCQEILSNKFFLPSLMSKFLISMAADRIVEKVPNFDIYSFKPFENAKNVQVPIIMIHGIQDSLVPVEHSRIIFDNLPKNTYKKLLEVEGEHNDCRSNSDINIIRDFIMQFAYDSLVIKEHKRRLNIKNAHLNYNHKNGININSIITDFRRSIKRASQMELTEKNLSKKSSNNITSNTRRKMNNFNLHNNITKKNIKYDNEDMTSFTNIKDLLSNEKELKSIRSKSMDTHGDTDLIVSQHKKLQIKDIKKTQMEMDKGKKKARRWNFSSKNNTSKELRSVSISKKVKQMNGDNRLNNIINGHHQSSIDVRGVKNEILLNNDGNFCSNSSTEKEIKITAEKIDLFPIPMKQDKRAETSMIYHPTTCDYNNRNPEVLERRFHTSISISPPSNKNKLRSDRNNILGGILGCEVRVKSNQIKITNLDKKSLRTKSVTEITDTSTVNTTVFDTNNNLTTLENNK